MPRYNYRCLNCEKKVSKQYADQIPLAIFEAEVLYETSHSMNPSEEELKEACQCPRCGSHKAELSYHGTDIISYTRGNGYLDRVGCKRDMHKFKLINDDPYAEYREPGEVDYLKDKLDKAGQYDPKTKYFTPSDSKDTGKSDSVLKK